MSSERGSNRKDEKSLLDSQNKRTLGADRKSKCCRSSTAFTLSMEENKNSGCDGTHAGDAKDQSDFGGILVYAEPYQPGGRSTKDLLSSDLA